MRGMSQRELDVVVIGAGPGGSVTAALLARLGYAVEIWEAQPFPRFRIGESLPPRSVALMKHLGFGPAVEAARFAVMEGHTSIWSDPAPKRAVFEEEAGLQVERSRFDQVMVEASDVPVRMGRTATDLLWKSGRVTGVRFTEGSIGGEVGVRWVVDATGPRSRFGLMVGARQKPLKQWALVGYWSASHHPAGSRMNDTIIESFSHGWTWSLRLASDLRNATVLFGEDSLNEVRAGREQFYQKALGSAPFTDALLEGATLEPGLRTMDASWLCADRFATPGLVLVGDAGSVIDPLSSQGVYKAMCAAMTAAGVVNTSLRNPEMERVALDYFDEQELRTFEGYAAGSVSTFREEQRWPDQPFWRERHALDAWDNMMGPSESPAAVSGRRWITSIEAGRASELELVCAQDVSIERRASLSDWEIVLSDCVVSGALSYGYRGARQAELVQLCRAFKAPCTVGRVAEMGSGGAGNQVLRSIAYLCGQGVLRQSVGRGASGREPS